MNINRDITFGAIIIIFTFTLFTLPTLTAFTFGKIMLKQITTQRDYVNLCQNLF